jgi:hypothetical protein
MHACDVSSLSSAFANMIAVAVKQQALNSAVTKVSTRRPPIGSQQEGASVPQLHIYTNCANCSKSTDVDSNATGVRLVRTHQTAELQVKSSRPLSPMIPPERCRPWGQHERSLCVDIVLHGPRYARTGHTRMGALGITFRLLSSRCEVRKGAVPREPTLAMLWMHWCRRVVSN